MSANAYRGHVPDLGPPHGRHFAGHHAPEAWDDVKHGPSGGGGSVHGGSDGGGGGGATVELAFTNWRLQTGVYTGVYNSLPPRRASPLVHHDLSFDDRLEPLVIV